MTASREFNFEAFAAKFDASLLKLLTAEVLTTKRSRRFSQRLHWHQQKNILRDLNNSGMAVPQPILVLVDDSDEFVT